jgi:hypothetical protein
LDELRQNPDRLGRQFAGATPADLAYLAGDHSTARDSYLDEAVGTPERPSAWAGLGLALSVDQANDAQRRASDILLRRPELVRAVYHATMAITDKPISVVDIAEWLDVAHCYGTTGFLPGNGPGGFRR